MTSEQLPPGWHPDPTGQPGQKYWDGQTWQATAPPTIPPVRKSKTWKQRIGIAAAVVLALVLGAEAGDSFPVAWGGRADPDDGTDPDDGADPEDGRG
jgi:Protein of unknown function (DUF2510)